MKTLLLIDGHAQIFRAYHAIRSPMSSPVTKEPTNATFGFAGMLLKILREQKPDYLAMVVDVSGDRQTFRSEIYPEYKANRDPMPEDLRPQVGRCIQLVHDIGAPILGEEGVEADDVIATIVRKVRAAHPDVLIRIVSKDKDLMQLLEEGRVELFDAHKDEVIDVEKLLEDRRVRPDQVIDLLALTGDSVDNVPGVPGVGPKTAADLLEQFGSLAGVIEHADEIKGKRGENIRGSIDLLGLSKKLVTLKDDVKVEFKLDDFQTRNFDLNVLDPIFAELGFNRHRTDLKELIAGGGGAKAEPKQIAAPASFGGLFDEAPMPAHARPEGDYRCVRTKKDLAALVKELEGPEMIAVDTETTSLSPRQADLVGLSFSTKPGTGWYVPVRSRQPGEHLDGSTVLDALRPILEDGDRPKCGHNIKFDLLVLRQAGVELRGIVFDSMVASFLIDSSRSSHGMDALALALLNHRCQPITDLIGTGKDQRTFDRVPLDDACAYAAEDADVTLQLRNTLAPTIGVMRLGELFSKTEMPLVEVLAELEWNGIACDPDELDRQAEALAGQIDTLRERILESAPRPFNPDSPKQLAGILFNAPDDPDEPGLGIKPLRKTKTGYSTDAEVLEKLGTDPEIESETPRLILEYRQLTKLVGTYLVALKEAINPRTGRIHASFHQAVAATGRLSSSDPNLQNIPIRTEIGRAIRKAFVAPPGRVLIGADYSQIELRVLAHLSRDPGLIEAFEKGEDIHRAVAAQIHGVELADVTGPQRDSAKMVNFGIVYGVTPFGLARRLGISNTEAGAIIDDYKRRFVGITTFLEECIAQAKRFGYVETILGRRRQITNIDARNPQQRALAERIAINSVVQGSAADLIKLAMLDLHRRLSPHAQTWRIAAGERPEPEIDGVLMLLQIHDELVFEAPEEATEATMALVVDRMQRAMELRVPLVVEAASARTWFESK
ncbi:MAG: DNA polymerase I [Phycisphaeraceae bacterium]|nr:DNA polymerase I [Phycisphaeraceae bacterium]MCB9847517.1 DNA polymerase I [Phycisphaeraceae bacterium]